MSPTPTYPSEWAVDVTLIVGTICCLVIVIGFVWILFKVGILFERAVS